MSVGEDVEDGGGDPGAWERRRFDVLESPTAGMPVAAPLERCASLLGRPLAEVEQAAAAVAPYWRSDGRPVWSLMLLGRALGQPRGGRGSGGGRSPWRAENRATYRRDHPGEG